MLPIEEARNIQEEISYWAAKALFAGAILRRKDCCVAVATMDLKSRRNFCSCRLAELVPDPLGEMPIWIIDFQVVVGRNREPIRERPPDSDHCWDVLQTYI